MNAITRGALGPGNCTDPNLRTVPRQRGHLGGNRCFLSGADCQSDAATGAFW